MDNIYITAGIIAFIFFLGKFVEMRFIEKESKPLKVMVKDMLLVYVCVLFAFVIIDQLKPILEETTKEYTSPGVFTDNPNF